MRFSKAVVKYRAVILAVVFILMIPSVFGIIGTRINYDMLDYLPEDIDTVIGQNELLQDFGKGAFSFIIVQDMPGAGCFDANRRHKNIEHVETVLWYNSLADISIPMELLPDEIYNEFNTDNATLRAVFFDSATSADETMNAIREIRSVAGKQCFVFGAMSGFSD